MVAIKGGAGVGKVSEAAKKRTAKAQKARTFSAVKASAQVIPPPQQGASRAGWHKISAKLECDKKYQLQELWGVRVPTAMTPDALGVGSLFHAGRAHWFQSGFPDGIEYERKLHAYMEDAALRMPLPLSADALNRAKSYTSQYISHWSARAKPTPVGVEYDISAPLMGPGFDDRTARVDDCSYYPEYSMTKLCIGEAKTTSDSVAAVVKEYLLHGQLVLQALLWEASKNGRAKHGEADAIMLDVVVKGYGSEKCKFGRVPIRIPDYVKNWYLPMLLRHVHEAVTMTKETPVLRNITACTKMIGRMRVPCTYQDLCLRGKQAATMYVLPDGHSLATAKYEGEARPWD